ncbi:hypothetical protein [Hyphomicrobium sp. CS1GBMeth3]|uniref:hypothetical protein n=1 Tax=Hyphomicrobium sp. CS1GBMeth3 TaxID=1892845 RepID=UPI000930CC4F|nr:hypothetical protein [Hyphomicrobium sp. CS1GBMeth3]
MLYGLLGAVAFCCAMAAFDNANVWLNRAGLVADIAGLLQLEVSGVFDLLAKAAFDADKRGENIPSSLAREITATPEEDITWSIRLSDWLKTSPKAGVILIGIGCSLQLLGSFF